MHAALAPLDIYEQQDAPDMAGTVLLLPGKTLNVTSINKSRLFKNKGNKSGALEVLNSLEEAGLGTLIQLGKSRGTAMVNIELTMGVGGQMFASPKIIVTPLCPRISMTALPAVPELVC